ncbi:MAG: hypothetical protein RLZZ70_343 [Candidatus Parcubacteria bacterium]|jgi:hypothetical protein
MKVAEKKKRRLVIRCSDGMTTTPNDASIDDEIRLPGGILFPSLCAQQFKRKVVTKLLRIALDFAIKTMVKLKDPDEIVLMAHDPCGAAFALQLSHEHIVQVHTEWETKLREAFPNIKILLMHEEHCAAGEWRKPHRHLAA